MSKNYYCLVASLREYSLEGDRKGFDASAIIGEIAEELSHSDSNTMRLFYTYSDLENIISLRAGRTALNTLGNLSQEELEQEIKTPELLPKELREILSAYSNPEEADDIDTSRKIERALMECYYTLCAKSSCRFIREWSEFDRNLRNVCAAYTARRTGLAPAEVIVGEGYVADALSRSSAADFGLKGEIEYIDSVMSAVADDVNLLDKEHRIDLIRWNMSDDLASADYFNINALLSYLVKINIIHRWVSLDRARGEEMLMKLIASFDGKELIENAEKNDN